MLCLDSKQRPSRCWSNFHAVNVQWLMVFCSLGVIKGNIELFLIIVSILSTIIEGLLRNPVSKLQIDFAEHCEAT